jgi:hypothetical protein
MSAKCQLFKIIIIIIIINNTETWNSIFDVKVRVLLVNFLMLSLNCTQLKLNSNGMEEFLFSIPNTIGYY